MLFLFTCFGSSILLTCVDACHPLYQEPCAPLLNSVDSQKFKRRSLSRVAFNFFSTPNCASCRLEKALFFLGYPLSFGQTKLRFCFSFFTSAVASASSEHTSCQMWNHWDRKLISSLWWLPWMSPRCHVPVLYPYLPVNWFTSKKNIYLLIAVQYG